MKMDFHVEEFLDNDKLQRDWQVDKQHLMHNGFQNGMDLHMNVACILCLMGSRYE
jgi:hypothetical protein